MGQAFLDKQYLLVAYLFSEVGFRLTALRLTNMVLYVQLVLTNYIVASPLKWMGQDCLDIQYS